MIDLSHEQGYRRGHIPNAINLPVEKFDFTRQVDVFGGITIDDAVRAMKSCGVCDETSEIILYDNSGLLACRLWFVLRYFGFRRIRLLKHICACVFFFCHTQKRVQNYKQIVVHTQNKIKK